jgi:hypothetical protein
LKKLTCLILLALFATSCATLPKDCAAGQTVVWDDLADAWACANPASGVERHTHQVTEIKTSCEDDQVVVWNREASGWICTGVDDHAHVSDQLNMYPPTYYYASVLAENAEELESTEIEGHNFCALSETRVASGGRCEVVRTTEGFILQAWANPRMRTECGAVCF